MIIGVCGYGYTGSGAVIDFLKEFDECSISDAFEFCFTYIPYGIEDLYFHLVGNPSRYNSSEAAIKDFLRWVEAQNTINNAIQKGTGRKFVQLSHEYINSLVDVSWNGYSSFDYVHYGWFKKKILFRVMRRVDSFFNSKFRKELKGFPNSEMYVAYPDKDVFIEKSKAYIRKLIAATMVDSTKKIVLNQPYEANAPIQSFIYFDDPKAIVVDKDPRDLYLLAKKVVMSDARFIPTDNVSDFIKYYRVTHKNLVTDARTLRISFESLVYDYDATTDMIRSFLQLSEGWNRQKYFNPSQSINNTQLYRKYTDYEEDIRIIEHDLKDWLFDFDKYSSKPNFQTDSF